MDISDKVGKEGYDEKARRLLLEDNICEAIRDAQMNKELTRLPTIMRYIPKYEKDILVSTVEESLKHMSNGGGQRLVQQPSMFGYLYFFPAQVEKQADVSPLIGIYK